MATVCLLTHSFVYSKYIYNVNYELGVWRCHGAQKQTWSCFRDTLCSREFMTAVLNYQVFPVLREWRSLPWFPGLLCGSHYLYLPQKNSLKEEENNELVQSWSKNSDEGGQVAYGGILFLTIQRSQTMRCVIYFFSSLV